MRRRVVPPESRGAGPSGAGRAWIFAALLPLVAGGCALDPLATPQGDGGLGGAGGAHGGAGGGSPSGGCASDAACDDANPCTVDRCAAGACLSAPSPQGASCADRDHCNGEEACDGLGQCLTGTPLPIDDGDPCTKDTCVPASGHVSHDKIPGCAGWTATPLAGAPSPRENHTAVWSGSRMIVWGGNVTGKPPVTATGALYDPVARAWTPTSLDGAPPARHSHIAVWTGSTMIVWGGYGTTSFETTGGIYDPASDTWKAMSTTGAPEGRVQLTGVWTGTELLVWGGQGMSATLATGGRYDPKKDVWTPMPAGGAPSSRAAHTAVWDGSRMVVWGGTNTFDWQNNGAYFDPQASAWTGPINAANAPGPRQDHTAVWSGSAMVLWGGWNGGPFLDSGGSLDPAGAGGGTWTPTSTTSAPAPRHEHTAVWTGAAMMIWGGCGQDACALLYDDGGLWTPDASGGTWKTVAATATLSARHRQTAVWDGSAVVLWGGRTATGLTSTGAELVP